jgi:maltose alpha-D-glucosyltransferase/alpha-amylase
MAPVIAEQLSVFEATPNVPVVARIHGDLHLGRVLLAPDGPRIVDFDGDPTRPIAERRQPASPLRDVASMLRSLDHAGRSASRRAERRPGRTPGHAGLDVEGWLRRARVRFLEAYQSAMRGSGAGVAVDEDLLRAFELDRACRDLVLVATSLPDATRPLLEGVRELVEDATSMSAPP